MSDLFDPVRCVVSLRSRVAQVAKDIDTALDIEQRALEADDFDNYMEVMNNRSLTDRLENAAMFGRDLRDGMILSHVYIQCKGGMNAHRPTKENQHETKKL